MNKLNLIAERPTTESTAKQDSADGEEDEEEEYEESATTGMEGSDADESGVAIKVTTSETGDEVSQDNEVCLYLFFFQGWRSAKKNLV